MPDSDELSLASTLSLLRGESPADTSNDASLLQEQHALHKVSLKPGQTITRSALKGLEPSLITDTSRPLQAPYVPRVPTAASDPKLKRQLILDTETTGFNAQQGDRIVEVGIVEFMNRRPTGSKFHIYVDPERDMPEDAVRVHGIEGHFLKGMPLFSDIADLLFEFLDGAELIAHNAPFDVGFLNEEFSRVGKKNLLDRIEVIDTLAIAKTRFPGQRNSLDALVKRLEIPERDRTFHGALLDAEILADVYLALTGGQTSLILSEKTESGSSDHERFERSVFARRSAAGSDLASHQAYLDRFFADTPDIINRWTP